MHMHAYTFLGVLFVASTTQAQIADFDTLPEGSPATVIVDGGLTFSNMVNGLGGTPNFTIEQADATLTGLAGFTSPMTLTFGGYSPGPDAAFTRCISFEITPAGTMDACTLELYTLASYGGNSITLEALAGTTVVASHTVPAQGGWTVAHTTLTVSGAQFDRLVVRGSGPTDMGAFFGVVDHVVVTGGGGGGAQRFCAGDGLDTSHTTRCPCTNFGALGHGCANSVQAGGANLDLGGDPANDNVVLDGSDMPATVSCIYLQGDALADAVFGDGVRCTGGTLIRLRTKQNVNGSSRFPDATDTVTLSQRGSVTPGSGVRRYYQTYYRNSAPMWCPPDTFNVTNGWSVDW
ncbi:MAG: hypothetical protein HZA53_15120 [Planctomycetes bacterium]|nr:hypothetical protein [Planctomycetota bacterium]